MLTFPRIRSLARDVQPNAAHAHDPPFLKNLLYLWVLVQDFQRSQIVTSRTACNLEHIQSTALALATPARRHHTPSLLDFLQMTD